jgi:microcystin-dependent protein
MSLDNYLGEIRMVAFNFAPSGWALCDGHTLQIDGNEALFGVLGTTFGGDETEGWFALPDLKGRVPIGAGQGQGLSNRPLGNAGGAETVALGPDQMPDHYHSIVASSDGQSSQSPSGAVAAAGNAVRIYAVEAPGSDMAGASMAPIGGGQPHENMQPFLAVNFIISTYGAAPTAPVDPGNPFIGEIRMMAGGAVPAGWAACAGQMMPLAQYTMLFVLLGTLYGGNGKTTFALPDMTDVVPVGAGQGDGLSPRDLGQTGGSEAVSLIGSEMPSHGHAMRAAAVPATSAEPVAEAAFAISEGGNAYSSSTEGLATLATQAVTATGGGLAHNNLQPYQAVNYCIALEGDFPPRG